jgi:hypothetical protein
MNSFRLINLLLLLLIIAPNARAIYKYAPTSPLALTILYAFLMLVLINFFQTQYFKSRFEKWVGNYWYIFFVLATVTLVIWFAYPYADGLKMQMRGSDQDDCVIIGATQLLNFGHPYIQKSYFGSPCSPGMGMLLLYLPFVFLQVYSFGAIVFAVLNILLVMRYTGSIYQAAFFSTLLFGSLFQLEMLVVGSDLFILGCGIAIASLKISEAISTQDIKTIIWLAILIGLLSSTRINFLVIFPVMSFFIFLHWRKGAVIFGIISFCIAILPSAYIYQLNPVEFSPLHLLDKVDNLLQVGVREITSILSILAFLVGVYFVKKSVKNICSALLLSLSPSLLVLALGDLIVKSGGQLGQWEGANYLLPIIPLALTVLTIRFEEKKNNLKNYKLQ